MTTVRIIQVSRLGAKRYCETFHSFVVGLFPIILLSLANLESAPVPWVTILRPAAVVVLATAVSVAALVAITGDVAKASLSVSLAWLLVVIYPPLHGASQVVLPRTVESWMAAGYAVVGIVLVWRLQPYLAKSASGLLNTAAAGICVAVAGLVIIMHRPLPLQPWGAAVDVIGATVRQVSLRVPDEPPDIYYLVLDGFGRANLLQDRFGVDATPFVAALSSRGFQVPQRSRSNYSQTALSLASSMNAAYLDSLVPILGDSDNRLPLWRLIQNSAVIDQVRKAGYHFVMIGSDYGVTQTHDLADECHCSLVNGPSEFENVLVHFSLLRALPFHRWATRAHRRKVEESFERLESVAPEPRKPRFVFAHILVPHPPFVLSTPGTLPIEHGVFTFGDGDHYPGTRSQYIRGYAEQVMWTMQSVIQSIDAVDRRVVGRRPVWLIHGDHGSGSGLTHNSVERTDAQERMAIMMALRTSDERSSVANDLTPINGVRVVLNDVFTAGLPLLPPKSYLSGWSRPYRFLRVPEEGREGVTEAGAWLRSIKMAESSGARR